jgi:hypothetical protein
VDLWFRVYVNEASVVTLPKLLAFDSDQKLISCPPLSQKEWSIATEPGPLDLRIPTISLENKNPLPMLNGEVHFFKSSTSSLGASLDSQYLSTRLDGKALFSPFTVKGRIERIILKKHKAILNIGNVTEIKFRVPTFPETKKWLKQFSGKEDVRYWSICLSGADTYTSRCLMDSEVKTSVESDGNHYATIVVGPDSPNLKRSALTAGYNFISHSELRVPILFFRQMLARPDFDGNFEKLVPITPEALNRERS